MFWPDPTHQPTHPPNYTPTHGWGSLHRFQIFKQNWNISISLSAIEFWMIPGVPPPGGWGGGWMGVGVSERVHPTHVHTHVHTRTYDIIGNSRVFPQWGRPFAWNYHVYHTCVCVRAHVCVRVHVHMCRGHPPTTSQPHPPTPHPKSRREPKTPKFNKSWTNRDNSILFEDSLPLNIPELI